MVLVLYNDVESIGICSVEIGEYECVVKGKTFETKSTEPDCIEPNVRIWWWRLLLLLTEEDLLEKENR